MIKFQIKNTISGMILGTYDATSSEGALDLLARDAGFASHDDACEEFPVALGELDVTVVEPIGYGYDERPMYEGGRELELAAAFRVRS